MDGTLSYATVWRPIAGGQLCPRARGELWTMVRGDNDGNTKLHDPAMQECGGEGCGACVTQWDGFRPS